ncbi:MAG: AlbA family DNA-binding domain-containing protein [Sarcina sp.]
MDIKKLLRIIRREEGNKLDFKETLKLNLESEKKEFAKDVCALANSRGGRAYLVIGIRDKSKKIIGVSDECNLSEERVQQIISSRCDPPIPISLEEFYINQKKIIVITIFDGEQKPYQIKDTGAFYIRRGSITDVMRKGELLNVFQEKLDLDVESCPIVNSDERMLDENLLKKYFFKKGIELNNDNRDFLLVSSNILKIDKISGVKMCTLGSLLVFSEINSLCIPYNMIKIFNEIDNKNILFQGSLLSIIDASSSYIKAILPEWYPSDAILEAIKNAVLYRDYTLSNCIEVILGKNNIIVDSPGKFIEGNKGREFNYSKRNMWIYEKLISLDDEQRFLRSGHGFKRMNNNLKSLGKVKLIDNKERAKVRVIFPGYAK